MEPEETEAELEPIELDAPEEAEAAEEPELGDDPAEGEPDLGQGLVSGDGKLLGKFNTVNDLARSYKEAEKSFGRKSGEAAEYRKLLETQGFTFGEDGKAVGPQAAAPASEAAAPAQEQLPGMTPGHRVENGIEYDHLNMPVISETDWADLREEDPEEYMRLRVSQDALRMVRQDQYNAMQGQQQAQALAARQAEVRTLAKTTYGFDDAVVLEIEQEAQKALMQASPAARNNPDAYAMLVKAMAADKIPALVAAHRAEITAILAGNKEAIARGQKVVALEKGSVNAPAAAVAGKLSSLAGLNKEQRMMAKTLGVSEEDYAKNI